MHKYFSWESFILNILTGAVLNIDNLYTQKWYITQSRLGNVNNLTRFRQEAQQLSARLAQAHRVRAFGILTSAGAISSVLQASGNDDISLSYGSALIGEIATAGLVALLNGNESLDLFFERTKIGPSWARSFIRGAVWGVGESMSAALPLIVGAAIEESSQ